MSKAFDSLHPSLMINKLKAYGFSEESLSLIRSYISNRQNRVKLSGVTSSWKDAVRGYPQGSSFGPLPWNIFQNDMTYRVNNASFSMYADDHQLRYLGPHIWGKISQELRSKTSLQAFRRGVRALNVLGLLNGTCGCCVCSS